jgi:hypothetical protein
MLPAASKKLNPQVLAGSRQMRFSGRPDRQESAPADGKTQWHKPIGTAHFQHNQR